MNHKSFFATYKTVKICLLKNENLVVFRTLIFLSFSSFFDRSVFNFPLVIRTHPESNGLLCLLNWKYLEPFMCSSLYLPPLWNGNCEGRVYKKKQTRYDPYPSARAWMYCSQRSGVLLAQNL